MYSVVLLMSMTAAPEVPSFGGHFIFGCHGCYSSCHGCGGGFHHHKWHSSCHGCCGGITYRSTTCSGCYGGCTGCLGSCTGCYGASYAPYSCHGYGIYGGASYTFPTPYYYSGSGCYGYGYPTVPAYVTPKVEEKKATEKEEPKKTYLPASPNHARVIVNLPVDAKLYANGQLTTLTSSVRDFTTPTLERGHDFQYAMKVEYVRDGKTVTESQVVRVRAGQVSVVDFADQSVAATATSKVTVQVPQGAKLFVENQPRNIVSGKNEFETPKLQKGAEYTYSFRVELAKDGKNQSQTQRVSFKAGEPINVDFREIDATSTASTK